MKKPVLSLASTIPGELFWEDTTEQFRTEPLNEFAPLRTKRRTRVVITGIGAIAPNGNNVEEYWQSCLAGKSGIARITLFDPSPYPCQIAGEVKKFDPRDYMDFKEARRMSRSSQYALAATRMAAKDAGITLPVVDCERVGVYIGTAVGGYDQVEFGVRTMLTKGWNRISPFAIGAGMPNGPAFVVSLHAGTKGYLGTVTAACASGTQVIGEAAEVIRRGRADVMIAGGTESGVVEAAFAGFCQMRALSTFDGAPEGADRPFDKNRDGFVVGEGSAMYILESLEHAIARNAKIYAEVLGSSISSDAYDVAAPDPTGEGEARVMRLAVQDAGISADEVDTINAHGPGTLIGDPIETMAIKQVFGERAYRIPVNSTKSMIGHCLGAAGALEAMTCLLSLRDQKIHPTINYSTPDPECDLDYVPN
ncbi:MAG: beta-ketoacyl-[acyl-carrier-protein] synthase family protein, partial [Rudaea sp.]